jgi:hypothetical protein
MTIEEVQSFLDRQNWVFAKSYAKTFPHSYLRKTDIEEQETFVDVIKYIRRNGKVKKFYTKHYVYLEIGKYEYWDMGRPDRTTIILNRAEINDNARYRFPMPTDEEEEMLRMKLITRDEYLNALISKDFLTDQDKRQLEFLMNTTRRVEGGGKNIIDNAHIKVKYE